MCAPETFKPVSYHYFPIVFMYHRKSQFLQFMHIPWSPHIWFEIPCVVSLFGLKDELIKSGNSLTDCRTDYYKNSFSGAWTKSAWTRCIEILSSSLPPNAWYDANYLYFFRSLKDVYDRWEKLCRVLSRNGLRSWIIEK